jgi:hypothetical protein
VAERLVAFFWTSLEDPRIGLVDTAILGMSAR